MIMFLAIKYGAVYGFHHSFLGYFRPPSSPPNTMIMYKIIAKLFEVVGSPENIATQPSLAKAWAELDNLD